MIGIFNRTTLGDAYSWDRNEPEWQSFEEATFREIEVEFSAGDGDLASSGLVKRTVFPQKDGTKICPDVVVCLTMSIGEPMEQCVVEAKHRKTFGKRDALAVAEYRRSNAEIARIYIPADCKVRKGARAVAVRISPNSTASRSTDSTRVSSRPCRTTADAGGRVRERTYAARTSVRGRRCALRREPLKTRRSGGLMKWRGIVS